MKFRELPYNRPQIELVKEEFQVLFEAFEKADSFEEQWDLMLKIQAGRDRISTLYTLVSIRHSVDTEDEFYDKENDYFDEIMPQLQEVDDRFTTLLFASKWVEPFEARLGKHFFEKVRLAKKTFSPAIMEELSEEAKLSSTYDKIMGGAQIEFDGQKYTLSGIQKFFVSEDRALRKSAHEAYWGYLQDKRPEIESIYDEMVRLRNSMAKKLGYENFVQMGYDRFGRTDYDHKDVKKFREGVKQFFVPLAAEHFEKQRQLLGLDELYYYDLPFGFPTGTPKPQGDKDWMVARAMEMYDEMSAETAQFFRFLVDKELLDLEQKKGKAPGGYCTYMPVYGYPFIFSNFNGTSDDVDVLTHEFGHAFQVYNSRHHLMDELRWPGMESAEIHSMGMEYIAYPWMEKFFEKDTAKYFYHHQSSNIAFLPYGCLVDEFQHYVYEHPQATPADRDAKWRELEKVYTPWKVFHHNSHLEEGTLWQRQGHIFGSPFYYIDYCLAQIVAMQIFNRTQEDRQSLWQDYLTICKVGGTLPFTEILKAGHFENPFDEQVVKQTVKGITDFVSTIDPKTL